MDHYAVCGLDGVVGWWRDDVVVHHLAVVCVYYAECGYGLVLCIVGVAVEEDGVALHCHAAHWRVDGVGKCHLSRRVLLKSV